MKVTFALELMPIETMAGILMMVAPLTMDARRLIMGHMSGQKLRVLT